MMLDDILGKELARDFADEFGYLIEQFRVLGWKQLRPWKEFFSGFKPPQLQYKHLEQRMLTNLLHYRSNYFVTCVVIACVTLLSSPVAFLSIIAVMIGNMYFLVTMTKPITISDITLSFRHKQIIAGVISYIVLILTGGLTAITWTLIYCILATGLHMAFKPRNISSKSNLMYEEVKLSSLNWFGGESCDSSDANDPELGTDSSNSGNMRRRGTGTGAAHGNGQSRGAVAANEDRKQL